MATPFLSHDVKWTRLTTVNASVIGSSFSHITY